MASEPDDGPAPRGRRLSTASASSATARPSSREGSRQGSRQGSFLKKLTGSFLQEEKGLDEADKQRWQEMVREAGLTSRSASSHDQNPSPEEPSGDGQDGDGALRPSIQRSATGWANIPRKERETQNRLRRFGDGSRCLRSRMLAATILESEAFDFVMVIIILANAITIGAEQSIRVEGGDTSSGALNVLEQIFLVVYTVEITLRFYVNGFFKSFRDHWVKFDLVLVLLGWLVVWILPALAVSLGESSSFLTLRTLRLLRLARTARLLARMHELWMLVQMVTSCASTMVYTLVLLLTVLYLFSIVGVEVITNHDMARNAPTDDVSAQFYEVANEHFANLFITMMTLVQFVTLDSMANMYKPLVKADPRLTIYFVGMVLAISIVLMNLITAVIVNSALEQASNNKEIQRIQENKRRKKTIDELRNMFSRLDHDGSGTITLAEIMEATEEDQMLLKRFLTLESPLEIFRMLDIDNSGQLNIEEFCEGVIQQVTSDRSVEFKRIDKNFKQLRKEVRSLQLTVDKLTGFLNKTLNAGLGSQTFSDIEKVGRSNSQATQDGKEKEVKPKKKGLVFNIGGESNPRPTNEPSPRSREPVTEPEPPEPALESGHAPPVWATDLLKSLREELAQEFWQVRSDLARGIAVTAQQAAMVAAERPSDIADLHQDVAAAMKHTWASDRFPHERMQAAARPPDRSSRDMHALKIPSLGQSVRNGANGAVPRAAPAMPPAPPQTDTDSPRLEFLELGPWK